MKPLFFCSVIWDEGPVVQPEARTTAPNNPSTKPFVSIPQFMSSTLRQLVCRMCKWQAMQMYSVTAIEIRNIS
jgi:hypothetical protein